MQYDAVTENDELYIYSNMTGYMKALAGETKENRSTGLAYLRVYINSKTLPGISDMTINTNTFDVYRSDNPEVLKKIAETYIRPEWTR